MRLSRLIKITYLFTYFSVEKWKQSTIHCQRQRTNGLAVQLHTYHPLVYRLDFYHISHTRGLGVHRILKHFLCRYGKASEENARAYQLYGTPPCDETAVDCGENKASVGHQQAAAAAAELGCRLHGQLSRLEPFRDGWPSRHCRWLWVLKRVPYQSFDFNVIDTFQR